MPVHWHCLAAGMACPRSRWYVCISAFVCARAGFITSVHWQERECIRSGTCKCFDTGAHLPRCSCRREVEDNKGNVVQFNLGHVTNSGCFQEHHSSKVETLHQPRPIRASLHTHNHTLSWFLKPFLSAFWTTFSSQLPPFSFPLYIHLSVHMIISPPLTSPPCSRLYARPP
jgi:hypothetical protein